MAGNSSPYSPNPNMPGMTVPPNFLSRACFNADFMDGVITETTKEIEVFVKTQGATVGPTIAAVAAVAAIATAGAALAILLTALLAILPILALLLLLIRAQGNPLRLGQVMNDVQAALLNPAFPPGSTRTHRRPLCVADDRKRDLRGSAEGVRLQGDQLRVDGWMGLPQQELCRQCGLDRGFL